MHNPQPAPQPAPSAPVEATARLVHNLATHKPRLYAFVRSCVASRADAEEILQETTLALLRKLDESDRAENFLAWAYAVARIEVLRFRDRQRPGQLIFCQELVEQMAALATERLDLLAARQEALADCLEKLPPRDRALIHDYYDQGKSPADIAQGLNRSASLIYKSLERIRQALFACIERTIAAEGLS